MIEKIHHRGVRGHIELSQSVDNRAEIGSQDIAVAGLSLDDRSQVFVEISDRIDIERNISQNFEQCENDRHLDQQRQASGHRIGLILLIQLLNLRLHALVGFRVLFVFVLFLYFLDLRLKACHSSGRTLLVKHQRHHGKTHDQGKQDDRNGECLTRRPSADYSEQTVEDQGKQKGKRLE